MCAEEECASRTSVVLKMWRSKREQGSCRVLTPHLKAKGLGSESDLMINKVKLSITH